jgi:hypothetical protein
VILNMAHTCFVDPSAGHAVGKTTTLVILLYEIGDPHSIQLALKLQF